MTRSKLKNSNYRKIYEENYGPIPIDENGRTYDIHHIDGDYRNNDPSNLKAVSIEEHFQLHLDQKDYDACSMIALRLRLSPEEISEIARKRELKKVLDGTHRWLDGEHTRIRNLKMVCNGTHPWLGGEVSRRVALERINNNTHPWQGPNHNLNQLANGTHPSQDHQLRLAASERTKKQVSDGRSAFTSEFATARNLKWSAEGRNPLQGGEIQRQTAIIRLQKGTHPSQIPRTCDKCGYIGRSPGIFKHHFKNCKREMTCE